MKGQSDLALVEGVTELVNQVRLRLMLEDAAWGLDLAPTPRRITKALLDLEHARLNQRLPLHTLDVVRVSLWTMVPMDER